MTDHPIVSRDQWRAARLALLAQEKDFTRERDALSAARRALPWVKLDTDYVFDSDNFDSGNGKVALSKLFDGRSQLIVYHFMYHPDWDAGCKSCSFWADNFNAIIPHLNQRDTTMVAVSRAPLDKILAFRERMGWSFTWVSSLHNDFNRDFAVSFSPEELKEDSRNYNFGTSRFPGPEAPGLSVFYRDKDGQIFHTYSCYARGLDMLNSAYHHLDLLPKGRDEAALSYPMEWVRLRDEYADAS